MLMPNFACFSPVDDVRVCLRIHIGIYADGDTRLLSEPPGDPVDPVQLLLRFHIEHEDVGIEGIFDFLVLFPHAGINHLPRLDPRLERPEQLAAGDDVHASSQVDEGLQDRQVGVGLYRKADGMGKLGKGLVHGLEMALQGRPGIDVDRTPHFRHYLLDCHIFGVEFVTLVVEMVHEMVLLGLYV